jgi:histone acetyltransferase (RNA polymerase elongator complex component)
MALKYKNIPIFVSHFGCPNDCIFCNQKKINGYNGIQELENAKRIIDDSLQYIENKNTKIEIAFFGGSFTSIEKDRQLGYLSLAKLYLDIGKINGIRISTRPDYINTATLDTLLKYGVTTIELGVQSTDDEVLRLNNRGTTFSDTKKAVALIREYNFSLGLQIMTGMYGSSYNKDIKTAIDVSHLKPDFVRIYPTMVIEDTVLYDYYKNKKYPTPTLEETLDICSKIYKIYNDANIQIIRIGLMASDEINTNKVIGAYHPAFGELVISRYYFNKLVELIANKKGETLIIKWKKEMFSKLAGHKKENINKLKNKYNFKNVKFKENTELEVTVL